MYLYQLILIIVSIILIDNIFNNNKSPKKTIRMSIPKKTPPKLKLNKKVSFNLKKNIFFEMKNDYNKDLKHDKIIYGNKILNNNNEFSIHNIKIKNPQEDLINRLNKKNQIIKTNNVIGISNSDGFSEVNKINEVNEINEINEVNEVNKINEVNEVNEVNDKLYKDDIFIDQKSYWDNLNIGDFTERDYLNKQTNDFNIFKKNNSFQNIEISKLYDKLTNGITNPTPLIHDDESINNSQTHNINGYSVECNKLILNNIENEHT
jgi:hypothetical protein